MNTTENKVWAIISLYAISIITIAILLTSCGSTKYVDCDAYKTHTKSPKATKPHTYKYKR